MKFKKFPMVYQQSVWEPLDYHNEKLIKSCQRLHSSKSRKKETVIRINFRNLAILFASINFVSLRSQRNGYGMTRLSV